MFRTTEEMTSFFEQVHSAQIPFFTVIRKKLDF